ncbi:MAG: peptidoglycan DD-metalloendopeptidase family protein [Bacillota bacterium]
MLDEDKDRTDPRFVDQIRVEPKDLTEFKTQPQPAIGLKGGMGDLLKAQFKVVLRITGLMLCCAVLFVSGFYLGIYQGSLTRAPEPGIITGTYVSPGSQAFGGNTPDPTAPGGNRLGGTAIATGPSGTELGTAAGITTGGVNAAGPETNPALPAMTTETEPGTTLEQAVPPPTPEELLASLKWPVSGKIASEPGWVFSKQLEQWTYYSGVEITCENGAEVVAALTGSVKSVGVDPLLGTVVTLQHESRLETTYGRVYGVRLAPGDRVEQGGVLGTGGTDGIYFSIASSGEPLSARQCLAAAK